MVLIFFAFWLLFVHLLKYLVYQYDKRLLQLILASKHWINYDYTNYGSNIMGKITLNLDWVKLYSYTDWTFVFSNILPGFFLRQLTFIDMICYVIWDNVTHSTRPIRWSRPLRPLFLINFPDGKQVGLSLNISVWIMKISNGRKNTFFVKCFFPDSASFSEHSTYCARDYECPHSVSPQCSVVCAVGSKAV